VILLQRVTQHYFPYSQPTVSLPLLVPATTPDKSQTVSAAKGEPKLVCSMRFK